MFFDDLLRDGISQDVGRLCLLIACVGLVYTVAAARCVKQFFRRASVAPSEFPAISILKPLHGDEQGLRANMEALCQLTYPGALEIIFGVQDPHDPAIAQVKKLQADFPEMDISLIIDTREHGANRKISNVINITRSARHDILVLSDSDIGINPDYLHRIVAELGKPGIGLVTCLYRGHSHTGFWSRFASMAIDYSFLPNVIFGMKVGLAKPCFGSTMALRKTTLKQIGGFEAFADHLADDNAIGEAVRAIGLKIAIPAMLVTHSCGESRLRDLITHEIRWSRTIRLVAGAGFAGTVVTHPLPFALISGLIFHGSTATTILILCSILARLYLRHQVDLAVGNPAKSSRWWMLPIRDTLSFMIFCATFFVGTVTWRGRQFVVGSDGTLSPFEEL